MTVKPEAVRFDGPEELRELCEVIRLRLHAANRMAMGESNFAWEIAEVIGGLGRVLAEAGDELLDEFGNGYAPGTLNAEQQRQRLIEPLLPPV